MKVIITVQMKELVYTGVTLVKTKGDHVFLLLDYGYTINDYSFSSEHNISATNFVHHFIGCSEVVIVEN